MKPFYPQDPLTITLPREEVETLQQEEKQRNEVEEGMVTEYQTDPKELSSEKESHDNQSKVEERTNDHTVSKVLPGIIGTRKRKVRKRVTFEPLSMTLRSKSRQFPKESHHSLTIKPLSSSESESEDDSQEIGTQRDMYQHWLQSILPSSPPQHHDFSSYCPGCRGKSDVFKVP